MSATAVTFEQIENEHRQERAEDARRIALGLATRERIQEENSLSSAIARIEIVDLAKFAREHYER